MFSYINFCEWWHIAVCVCDKQWLHENAMKSIGKVLSEMVLIKKLNPCKSIEIKEIKTISISISISVLQYQVLDFVTWKRVRRRDTERIEQKDEMFKWYGWWTTVVRVFCATFIFRWVGCHFIDFRFCDALNSNEEMTLSGNLLRSHFMLHLSLSSQTPDADKYRST